MSLADTTNHGIDAGDYGIEKHEVSTEVGDLVKYLTSAGYKKYARVLHAFKAEKTGVELLMVHPVDLKTGNVVGGATRIHKSAVVNNVKIGDADSDQEEEELEEELEKELGQVLEQEPVPEPEPEPEPALEPEPATTGTIFAKGDWIEFKKNGEELRKGKITQDGRVLLVEDDSSSVAVSVYPNEVIGKCADPNESRAEEGEEAKKGEEEDEEEKGEEEKGEEEEDEEDEGEEVGAPIATRDPAKVVFFERLVNLMKSAPEKEVTDENKGLATATLEKYTSEPRWSDEDVWTVLGKLTTKKCFKKMVERTLVENKDISFPEELYLQVGKKRPGTTHNTKPAGKKQKVLLAPEDESVSEHDNDDDDDKDNDVADESGDPENTSNMVDALLSTTLDKCKKFPNFYAKRYECRIVNSLLIDTEAGADTDTPYQKLAAFVNEKLPDQKQKVQNKLVAMLYLMLATPCSEYNNLSQALKYVKESDSSHVMAFLCLKVLNKTFHAKAVRKLVLDMHTMLVRLAA